MLILPPFLFGFLLLVSSSAWCIFFLLFPTVTWRRVRCCFVFLLFPSACCCSCALLLRLLLLGFSFKVSYHSFDVYWWLLLLGWCHWCCLFYFFIVFLLVFTAVILFYCVNLLLRCVLSSSTCAFSLWKNPYGSVIRMAYIDYQSVWFFF